MKVFRRYLLIQTPSWVLAAVILTALHLWFDLPRWGAVALWVAYLIKDFILFRFLRRAYEESPGSGAERLIGTTGVATGAGYVRVRGELWRAEAAPDTLPLEEGAAVRVEDARGMTLWVRRRP